MRNHKRKVAKKEVDAEICSKTALVAELRFKDYSLPFNFSLLFDYSLLLRRPAQFCECANCRIA
jgi:hypothetical protein